MVLLTLEEALKARDEFLKQHPQHQNFQNQIDDILEKTPGGQNRMAVIAMLMERKLLELSAQFNLLAIKVSGLREATEANLSQQKEE